MPVHCWVGGLSRPIGQNPATRTKAAAQIKKVNLINNSKANYELKRLKRLIWFLDWPLDGVRFHFFVIKYIKTFWFQ